MMTNNSSGKRQKILILGTGLFAAEVSALANQTGKFVVDGFVESLNPENCRNILADRPIIWIESISDWAVTHKALCALGTTHRNGFINKVYALGFSFATLVHPTAQIPCESNIGEGSMLGAGSIVGAYSYIGKHVLINRGCLIGHHTTISDFCTISPGANIAGSVKIGERTFVGMGAIVLDHITIGANCIVSAGAVVTRDLPDRVQVTGVPAKIKKENIEGF
jgi:sugar O-acyltransferase (sialic acid O-acetyltransferase NeuD family)